jgi:hypothetical protein
LCQYAFRACFSLTRTHYYLRVTRRLVEVHIRFQLQQETLYMTFHLLDRFLSIQQISRSKLQLAGITAMLVASKYVALPALLHSSPSSALLARFSLLTLVYAMRG